MADFETDDIEYADLDELGSQSEEVVESSPQEEVEDIPEKFKGKSVKDLVKMYQESEKLIGRQGNEVGELRRVVDDFIRSQSVSKTQAEEIDEVDFYADPKTAVKKAIEKSPELQEVKQIKQSLKRAETLAKLEAKYPNYMEVAGDSAFQEWVASSKIRTRLMAEAETQFDFDAADELLGGWAERTKVASAASEKIKAERSKDLKAANVGTAGSTETSSKKIYRRSDIIELIKTNPSKYMAMQDEILQAYAENRVR